MQCQSKAFVEPPDYNYHWSKMTTFSMITTSRLQGELNAPPRKYSATRCVSDSPNIIKDESSNYWRLISSFEHSNHTIHNGLEGGKIKRCLHERGHTPQGAGNRCMFIGKKNPTTCVDRRWTRSIKHPAASTPSPFVPLTTLATRAIPIQVSIAISS